jgi:hypothetical protein
MPDSSQPLPVNSAGSVVQGQDMDGAQPQELARCGVFAWPPCQTSFPWGGLGGSVVAAEILRRNGYPDVFEWENRAVLRAYQWLDRMSRVDRFWWSEVTTGDDCWQPWLANFVYGTSFPGVSPTKPGRNMGWTDWTHAGRTGSGGRAFQLPPDSMAADRSAPALRRLRVRPRRFRAVRRGRAVAATWRGAGGARGLLGRATGRRGELHPLGGCPGSLPAAPGAAGPASRRPLRRAYATQPPGPAVRPLGPGARGLQPQRERGPQPVPLQRSPPRAEASGGSLPPRGAAHRRGRRPGSGRTRRVSVVRR